MKKSKENEMFLGPFISLHHPFSMVTCFQ